LLAVAALATVASNAGAQSDSFQRWRDLVRSGNPDAAFAMGERLVAAADGPTEQVRLRGSLAFQYQDHGNFRRARELVDQGLELSKGWRFRALPDGGESGYRKFRAMHQLHRAQCRAATDLRQYADATTSCRASLEVAQRALDLARFSGQGLQGAAGDVLSGTLDLAKAESAANALVEEGRQLPGRVAHFYREASAVAIDLGERRQALNWAQRAVSIWDGAPGSEVASPRVQGRVRLQRALVFAGQWQAANEEFDAFDNTVRNGGQPLASRQNLVARALAYAHAGRLATLRQPLAGTSAQLRARLGEDSPLTTLHQGLQGAALLDGARPEDALTGRALLSQAAARLMEAQRTGDAVLEGGLEAQAARFVLEQFLRAQQSGAGSEPERELAFQVADALRGSRVQVAIQDAAARNAATAAGLGDLVRQEQDLRSEIRALQDLLMGRDSEETSALSESGAVDLRQRMGTLQTERAQLQARIAQRFPAYATLVKPKLPTPTDVVRQLALGELFVLLLPVDDGVHVWTLSWTEQRHRFTAMAPERLAQATAAIRKSTDFGDRLQPYAVEQARWLGAQLLGPLQAQIQQARHMVLAAGGTLGSVPFAALPTGPAQADGEPWLIRRVAVSQVPSASAWLAIQRLALADRPQGALLAWGDPAFDARAATDPGAAPVNTTRRVLSVRSSSSDAASVPHYSELPALPETRDELIAIAGSVKADPARDLVLGAQATRESVLAANRAGTLAQRKVIAFATHGLMAGDLPNLNQPALALAATPDAESNPLAPLLTLDDVLGLRLNADWVVLSACNTAAADGRAEEALSGLARGFFYAGARSVLVTHWAVETESAKLLTTRTFEHYTANPYAGKAESLRQAMLSVMAMPKYQHPAFWAPYALVGDGAR
jgi:CHAT domain-containing protein